MKKLLLLLIFLPILSFAQEEWEYVGSSTDKSEFYIKDAEKKSYGNRVLFWSKTVLPNKTVKTKKGTVNKKGGYNVVKYEADCNEKTLKMLMFASYESNGNPKDTDSGPFFAEPVIPDTMGETLLESSCNKFKN